MELSNKPPKGTYDWLPEEYQVRKYIFDIWRDVLTKFGYKEYLTPLVENAQVYRAKSGEDVGNTELTTFEDRAGRELAIRPEMTPSVTRMVSKLYNREPKPIRLFSIANFFRNEKPQRGRNREFWQLNYDVFGDDSIYADIEIIQIALEIMLSFNPPQDSFEVYINNRKLIEAALGKVANFDEERKTEVTRVLDKWEKLSKEDFVEKLNQLKLEKSTTERLVKLMESSNSNELLENIPELEENDGFNEVKKTIKALNDLGYADWVKFKPNIIRGFDYYDGMVFEVFDKNPKNNRAMFGGGRYNGLADIFGVKSFPAVGCAPGDETTKLFLEEWDLIDGIKEESKQEVYYVPLLDESLYSKTQAFAKQLREEGKNVASGLEEQGIGDALREGNKQGYDYVVLLGEREIEEGKATIKNMKTGDQEKVDIR